MWLQEKPLGKRLEKMRGYGEFTALVANHPEFIRYSSVTDKVVVGVAAEITGRSGSWEDRKETSFLVIKVLSRGGGS